MIAIATLVFSLVLSALAAPAPDPDNGACEALQNTCASSVKPDLSDAWSIKACVFGATCYGGVNVPDAIGQRFAQDFLNNVWHQLHGGNDAPQAISLPRVTSSLFNSIAPDHKALTQQNFRDGFYSSLDASGGPYPISVHVADVYFERVSFWTECSSTTPIPFQNFADYFQYSPTVVNLCGAVPTSTTASFVPSATFVSSSVSNNAPTPSSTVISRSASSTATSSA